MGRREARTFGRKRKLAMGTSRLLPAGRWEFYGDYAGATGPNAVLRARGMSPEEIVDEIVRSGLRGRGGTGALTGLKWKALPPDPVETRTVILNAAEGEPGSFKDRLLLRRNPYAPLDGLLVAARAVGADRLLVAVKSDFSREIDRIRQAMGEMEASGLFDGLTARLVRVEDEYLLGEERALIQAVDRHFTGSDDEVLPYTPGAYSWGRLPRGTVVNNAETLAHVAWILREGAAAFRAAGTADTPGTLLVTVSGDVRRPGVYECEAGTRLRDLLDGPAGGPREGRRLKAVLLGVSGTALPEEAFDAPLEFGALAARGSCLGPAAVIALDEGISMPRVAQSVSRFLYVESCKQCKGCNHGLRAVWKSFDGLFAKREAPAPDLDELAARARALPRSSRCPLPLFAARMLPSLLESFREEFLSLLAGRGAEGLPYVMPKIDDYDEEHGRFAYDPMQPYKQPDRTYVVASR